MRGGQKVILSDPVLDSQVKRLKKKQKAEITTVTEAKIPSSCVLRALPAVLLTQIEIMTEILDDHWSVQGMSGGFFFQRRRLRVLAGFWGLNVVIINPYKKRSKSWSGHCIPFFHSVNFLLRRWHRRR